MIVIDDYKPSDSDIIEVQFPGDKTRYKVKSSDALTLGELRAIAAGDIDAFYKLFPADAHVKLDALHPTQLKRFIDAWTGGAGK